MTKKLSWIVMLSCALCSGQSAVTTTGSTSQAAGPATGLTTTIQLNATDPGDNPTSDSGTAAAGRQLNKSPLAEKPKAKDEGDESTPESMRKLSTILTQSDFQQFAEDAAGRRLMVFGRALFDEVPTTFSPTNHVPVPAQYVIGPGDELLIRVWGKVDLDTSVSVDRNGQISLPRIGTLRVAGLRFEQLESCLRAAVGVIYTGFELNVTMGQLRSMQVFVLGSARQPGAYTVSSLSTLIDALFASGGPSATGTMRHIQLRRGKDQVVELDLYDVLRRGDKSHDVPLLPGDVIYIPTIGAQVAIIGSVNEPGIYELKNETTIANAVEQAGGLTNLAATDRVLLERLENRRKHHVDELALDVPNLQRTLRDGDVLKISPMSAQFENAVMIRGNVAAPGRYPWHEGMRVSDLIPSREVLITNDHWIRQNHLADERHTDMLTDIAETNAEINWDYAAIERLDDRDLSTRLIPFNLGRAIDDPASADNEALRIGDTVTIFSRKDLALPLEKHETFVQISGEVNAPGVYRMSPGDNLRDLVARAGGLTGHSYLFASQLTRAAAKAIQQQRLDMEVERIERELTAHFAGKMSVGSTNPSGGISSVASEDMAKMSMQQSLLAKLEDVHATGRVVLGIKPSAKTLADIPDFPLEDGDSFVIPATPATVNVVGEVYNQNTFRYQPLKCLGAYLNDSGGATRMADVKRTFLIRADGTVVSRQTRIGYWSGKFEGIALMPGDAIIVPPRLKAPGGFLESLPVITQILSQTAMTGAMVSLVQ